MLTVKRGNKLIASCLGFFSSKLQKTTLDLTFDLAARVRKRTMIQERYLIESLPQ